MKSKVKTPSFRRYYTFSIIEYRNAFAINSRYEISEKVEERMLYDTAFDKKHKKALSRGQIFSSKNRIGYGFTQKTFYCSDKKKLEEYRKTLKSEINNSILKKHRRAK